MSYELTKQLLLVLLERVIFRKQLSTVWKLYKWFSLSALSIFITLHFMSRTEEVMLALFVKWKHKCFFLQFCFWLRNMPFPRQTNKHPLACILSERKQSMNDSQQTLLSLFSFFCALLKLSAFFDLMKGLQQPYLMKIEQVNNSVTKFADRV